eukprot:NODE_1193_length_1651_cov_39.951311_g1059_i0.p1 GENE.NODE_1193_length_1651_cov_39.951311_g1059_i0~~NODE_1193_length_1651_cov_39.951311_g1059_i0.p1  ORF type:complete len:430 (+),score=69.92 NODE_1193_length_1651_cov_39.951311_g1059_i0:76-1290(+)
MLGGPTGPCSPRSNPEFQLGTTSPSKSPKGASMWSQSEAIRFSPSFRESPGWKEHTRVPEVDSIGRREGRLCVHADTCNNTVVYPNYMFDPDGEVVPTHLPGTFDMTNLVSQQADGIDFAGQATGIVIASAGDPAKSPHVSVGTFFQVSPTRAIACFHNVAHPFEKQKRLEDVYVSKVCTVTHWEALIAAPKSRSKYFRRARILPEADEFRSEMLPLIRESMKMSKSAPRVPLDIVILELPSDFCNDPYLKPLPRNKFKTIKKVGVVAYNQREIRREEDRLDVYQCTQGIPTYDQEPKYIHHGSKSLSPGILVNYSDQFITYETSLTEGSAGGPLLSITRPHYFWGIHCCAMADSEPNQPMKSHNYNMALSFYHPGVLELYEKFVLPTLPQAEQFDVYTACLQS